jgi:hypothetical protein
MKLTRGQVMEGRRRLKRLLPGALDAVRSGAVDARPVTEIVKVVASHITLDKLDAVVISEGERGGWHVDVMFRNMPPGVSAAIGTPVQAPLPTRQEAQDHAPVLLAYVVKQALADKTPIANPVFEFHGGTVSIPSEVVRMLLDRGFGQSGYTPEKALRRLAEIEAELFPEGVSPQRYEQLSPSQQTRLLSVMTMAAATGIFRYPEPEAAPPGDKPVRSRPGPEGCTANGPSGTSQ